MNHNVQLPYRIILLFIAFLVCNCSVSQQAGSLSRYGLRVIKSLPTFQNIVMKDSIKEMVELKSVIASIQYDLRYATVDNFMGRSMYPTETNYTFLRRLPVKALSQVTEQLKSKGFILKIFDAYRPYSVTEKFWELVKDRRYVANPSKGSGHNRGLSIDLTIIDQHTGKELDMGTGFDNFSDTAAHGFSQLPEHIIDNRKLLKQTMEKFGFRALDTEWWHYSWPNNREYEVLDLSFEELFMVSKRVEL